MSSGKIDQSAVAVALVVAIVLVRTVTQSIAESPDTLLMNATKRGDLKLVQQLLRQGVNPNSHDAVHNTPLTFAARDGRLHIAKALIEAGAHVNWVDDEKVTPLILAAFKGHTDIVDLLLVHAADPMIRDQWDRTALDYALRRGEDHPIVKALRHAETQNK